jgi:hypothetical protein
MGDKVLDGAADLATGLDVYAEFLDHSDLKGAGSAIRAINKPLSYSLSAKKVEDTYYQSVQEQ